MLKVIKDLTPKDLASITDHTYLERVDAFRSVARNPIEARQQEFSGFLSNTLRLSFKPYSVCVRHEDVPQTKEYFNGSGIKIAAVAGFPEGSKMPHYFKVQEAKYAIDNGADEIDFVMNYDALKAGDIKSCQSELFWMSKLNARTKMILETSELNASQVAEACGLADYYGIDFVKTSSGYTSSGANVHDLTIMRNNFSRGIKPSGGVNWDNVFDFLEAASGREDGKIDLDPMKIRIGAGAKFLENAPSKG